MEWNYTLNTLFIAKGIVHRLPEGNLFNLLKICWKCTPMVTFFLQIYDIHPRNYNRLFYFTSLLNHYKIRKKNKRVNTYKCHCAAKDLIVIAFNDLPQKWLLSHTLPVPSIFFMSIHLTFLFLHSNYKTQHGRRQSTVLLSYKNPTAHDESEILWIVTTVSFCCWKCGVKGSMVEIALWNSGGTVLPHHVQHFALIARAIWRNLKKIHP